jgi:hypothetical protein
MILVCSIVMYFACVKTLFSFSWFKQFLFADNMEVDDDYESSLDEEPVSHFSYLIEFFFCYSESKCKEFYVSRHIVFVNLRRILFFEAITIHMFFPLFYFTNSIYLILYCYMAANIFSFINCCSDQQKLVIDFFDILLALVTRSWCSWWVLARRVTRSWVRNRLSAEFLRG